MTAKPKQKLRKPSKKADKPAQKLTVSERRTLFVEAYLQNGGNATRAAMAAGYSEHSAHCTGGRLLKHASVSSRIEQRHAELRQKHELTTESVLISLRQAIQFDPRKLYNADGTLKRVIDLDDDTAMALAGVEAVESSSQSVEDGEVVYTPISTKKLKWLDKNAARDQANKILGNYNADKTPADDPMVAATDRASKGMQALQAQFLKIIAKHTGAAS